MFDATGDLLEHGPAEMRIGDSIVMVSGIEFRGKVAGFIYIYVPEVDATYGRAVAAGAETIEEPTDAPYGDRRATVIDPWGNVWQIATRIGAISGRRLALLGGSEPQLEDLPDRWRRGE